MTGNKIFTINRLAKILFYLKKRNKKTVFTNGCFDILHIGHITYLNKARKLGDALVVALNSDSSVKSIKGKNRPINKLKDREKTISSLECVDYICHFNQNTPLETIKRLKPDILVKGGDWKNKKIVGSDFVKNSGGKVITIPFVKGYSTTKIIKKLYSL
ncbi:MAG: D-glycero-beta-D-manno-heptose 1-phosphate adenylyltransferase [Candidatus Omnitrophota bacterium]